jgi:hypothetical protein
MDRNIEFLEVLRSVKILDGTPKTIITDNMSVHYDKKVVGYYSRSDVDIHNKYLASYRPDLAFSIENYWRLLCAIYQQKL